MLEISECRIHIVELPKVIMRKSSRGRETSREDVIAKRVKSRKAKSLNGKRKTRKQTGTNGEDCV
jgi:hypothetical protein